MASSTVPCSPRPELTEAARRRPCASGVPVVLADGMSWLLAEPRYRASGASLTLPDVDFEIDRLFESSTLRGAVELVDVWSAARVLLSANYEISDAEFTELVSLGSYDESEALSEAVIGALFGPRQAARSYTDWARGILVANAISDSISPGDLANVLAILVSTGRATPSSEFIDACRAAEEQATWEEMV